LNYGLITNDLSKNERQKRVSVVWSYPKELSRHWDNEALLGRGLYYISRKFGNKETLLYFGQTYDSYYTRLLCHDLNWLYNYRGKKLFRLGEV